MYSKPNGQNGHGLGFAQELGPQFTAAMSFISGGLSLLDDHATYPEVGAKTRRAWKGMYIALTEPTWVTKMGGLVMDKHFRPSKTWVVLIIDEKQGQFLPHKIQPRRVHISTG